MKESDKALLCKVLRNPFVHSTAGLSGAEAAQCKRLANEVEGVVPASRPTVQPVQVRTGPVKQPEEQQPEQPEEQQPEQPERQPGEPQ